uniref:MARVEL domain-containing protein n=1 Tax=Parascaris equorum TaxID=6256 RepID=A0A914RL91_PAREQ
MKRKEMGRYEYENMKNKLMASRAGYIPAPTAPKLEVTINQNCGDTVSNYSGSRSPSRPPLGPPPPPPTGCEYAQPTAPVYNPLWIDRFPRRENKGMYRVALVEAMLAVVILGGGIWCYSDTPDYCPYYSAIWTSVVYLMNAVVGSFAAKVGSINLYMAHLVLSLISIMMCAVSGILSARNWALVGTYQHPKINRNQAFCLLGEHDAPRLSYIFSQMDQYDFKACLFELKVGVAVNSVQFVIACIEGILLLFIAFYEIYYVICILLFLHIY